MQKFVNPPTAKYQVRTQSLLPHKCMGCGVGFTGKEEFIDTTISYDWEGAQYLCVSCVKEMARAVGYEDPVALQAEIVDLEFKADELSAENERLTDLLDSYRSILGDLGSPVADSDSTEGQGDSEDSGTPVAGAVESPKSNKSTTKF